MLIINFEGREAKGLSKGRFDETFAGEDGLDMILYNKRITKVPIRLCICAGWSAPVLFANPRRQVFSRRGPYNAMVGVHRNGQCY